MEIKNNQQYYYIILKNINQLHGKCDKTSRKERKVLVSAASTGSNKKDCNLFKVNIKGLIKGNRAGQLSKRSEKSAQMRNEVSSFYEENSAPLPLKKKVSKKTGMAQRAMKRSTEALYKDYRQKGGAASFGLFLSATAKTY